MPLRSKEKSGILYIELSNNKFGNSFGQIEAEDLSEIHKNWKSSDLKGLVFYSKASKLFCAGGNLRFYASHERRNQGILANRKISGAIKKIEKWPIPTVVVVDGDCFGGGMELISAFDNILSAPSSFFGFWQRRIGLSFGWGGGSRWLKRTSGHQLKKLSLEARSVSSYEAQKLGLVDKVVISGRLMEEARAWISHQDIWANAPIKGLKSFTPQKEKALFEGLWWNKDHKKILEKVKPSQRSL